MEKDKFKQVIKTLDNIRNNDEALIEEIVGLYLEDKGNLASDMITENDERTRRILLKELLRDIVDYTLDYTTIEVDGYEPY